MRRGKEEDSSRKDGGVGQLAHLANLLAAHRRPVNSAAGSRIDDPRLWGRCLYVTSVTDHGSDVTWRSVPESQLVASLVGCSLRLDKHTFRLQLMNEHTILYCTTSFAYILAAPSFIRAKMVPSLIFEDLFTSATSPSVCR